MKKRYDHGAISDGAETMIIGGYDREIEVWKMSDTPFMHDHKIINETFTDNDYYPYPVLFIVPKELVFCQGRKSSFLGGTLTWSLGLFLGLYLILCLVRWKFKGSAVSAF